MTATSTTQQFSTFRVAGLFLGIEVEQVQEVLRHQSMTPVPLAPGMIGGLINLRGQIVTAVDLRRRLGLAVREDGRPPMNVVIRSDDGPIALLVDEIGDVVEASETDYEPCPETVQGVARELIAGTYKTSAGLLLILDTVRAVDPTSSTD